MLEMMQSKKGFTLIELVMVIVILGILAAVAIPRYLNLREEALDASFRGICGGLKSTAAILIGSSTATVARGQLKTRLVVRTNTDVGAEVTLTDGASGIIAIAYEGSSRNCTLGMGSLTSD